MLRFPNPGTLFDHTILTLFWQNAPSARALQVPDHALHNQRYGLGHFPNPADCFCTLKTDTFFYVSQEPAVTPAGISYERNALMQWLEQTHTEPSTKRRLKRSRVVPNLTLRGMIEDWLSDRRAERRERLARKATMARKADSGKTTGEDDTETDGVNQVNPVSLSQPSTSTHQGVGVGLPQENSRLHRPRLPARAGAVSQDTRDELRRARQVMYVLGLSQIQAPTFADCPPVIT